MLWLFLFAINTLIDVGLHEFLVLVLEDEGLNDILLCIFTLQFGTVWSENFHVSTLFPWPYTTWFLLLAHKYSRFLSVGPLIALTLLASVCSYSGALRMFFMFHHCYVCLWYISGSSENSCVPPLPTAFPKRAGRVCITASTVVPAMLKNVRLNSNTDVMCAALLTVPSFNICKLLHIGHKTLIIQPPKRHWVFIPVPPTSGAIKIKVKFSLEQATKVQRSSRCIALLFL